MVDKRKEKVTRNRPKVIKNKSNTDTADRLKGNKPKSNKNQATADRLKGNKPKSNINQATADRLKGNKPKSNRNQATADRLKGNKPKSNRNQATADRLKGNKPKSNINQATADRLKGNKPTTKKAPGTLKKIAKVAGKTLRSPVGKFGIPGALATAAYYGYKEFAGKKKKPVAKKPVAKKKVVAKKRKLSPGESEIRKSDIMGGSKGRLSGPSGPLGSKIDKRKKSTVVKNRNTRFDPKKANRAGQRKGQR